VSEVEYLILTQNLQYVNCVKFLPSLYIQVLHVLFT